MAMLLWTVSSGYCSESQKTLRVHPYLWLLMVVPWKHAQTGHCYFFVQVRDKGWVHMRLSSRQAPWVMWLPAAQPAGKRTHLAIKVLVYLPYLTPTPGVLLINTPLPQAVAAVPHPKMTDLLDVLTEHFAAHKQQQRQAAAGAGGGAVGGAGAADVPDVTRAIVFFTFRHQVSMVWQHLRQLEPDIVCRCELQWS